jgi:hypothetical protein
MADAKISALTAASTPLAGTEVLPIVQSGTTKKVSVANLTAGRAVSASNVTVSTGAVGLVSSFSDGVAQGIVLSSGSGYFGIYNPNYGDIAFRSGGNTSDTFRIAEAGNLTVGYGNLVIGTSGKGVTLPGGITWTSGSGSPEGVVTAPVGSLYSRSDGGAGTSLYVKQSGSGNTGWAGK